MTSRRRRPMALTMALIAAALLTSACVATPKRAIPWAAWRAQHVDERPCPAAKIKVVSREDDTAVLDVCGVHQKWVYSAVSGYEYAGDVSR